MTAKPYSVWVKYDGSWQKVFETHCPPDARDFALNKVSHTGWHVERIEIRDLTGPLDAVFDRSWAA